MNRAWIAAGLLVLSLGMCIFSYGTLVKSCDEMQQTIKTIKISAENGDDDTLQKCAEDLKKQWGKALKIFSAILTHSHFDDIDKSINDIGKSAEENDKKALGEQCDEAIYYLEHLKESESFSLKNIF